MAGSTTTPREDDSSLGLVGAVAVLVGFYVGVVLLAAALVGVGVLLFLVAAEIGGARSPAGWVFVGGVSCAIAALVVVWSVLPRFHRFQPPGPELLETDAPMLFAEIGELAAATGQAAPTHVYLVHGAIAAVTERGGMLGLGSRRVLILGLPLLEILTVDELRSVLGRELGHFDGGDTKTMCPSAFASCRIAYGAPPQRWVACSRRGAANLPDRMPSWLPHRRLAVLTLLAGCGRESLATVGESTGSSGTTTTTTDSSTTEPPADGMRFFTLALSGERLCAITSGDGRVVCRARGECDAGKDPEQWDLDDPACWVDADLPGGAYTRLEIDSSLYALRADDGSLVGEPDTMVPSGAGFVDLAASPYDVCATDGSTIACNNSGPAMGVLAVDGNMALVDGGIVNIQNAATGCLPPECEVLSGDFVELFAADGFLGFSEGCGLREDGTVECTVGVGGIVSAQPIAQVDIATDLSYCVRLDGGDVECSPGLPSPDVQLVDIATASFPVHHGCGIASDGAMTCWGEGFPWCGDEVCAGPSVCVEDECRYCDQAPCTPCGDGACSDDQDCLDGECYSCGAGDCIPCDDGYCLSDEACIDGSCVNTCMSLYDCAPEVGPLMQACIDGACASVVSVPACDDALDFVATELPVSHGDYGRVVAFDADDDAVSDLLVADESGVRVVHGPTLADTTQISDSDGAPLVAVAHDFDADGDIDIAVADPIAATITIFDNDGAWSESDSSTLPASTENGVLVAADADGDGLPDLLYAYQHGNLNDGVSWHRNLGGILGFAHEIANSSNVIAVATYGGDLDRDGVADYAWSDPAGANVLSPATGEQTMLLTPYALGAPNFSTAGVAIADFDGDGAPGVALVQLVYDAPWIEVWRDPGQGAEDGHVVVTTPTVSIYGAALGQDLDGDGDDELLVTGSDHVRVLLGSGLPEQPFDCTTTIATPIEPYQIVAGDFNGDGSVDLVVSGALIRAPFGVLLYRLDAQ